MSAEEYELFTTQTTQFCNCLIAMLSCLGANLSFRTMVGVHLAAVSAAQLENYSKEEFMQVVETWWDIYSKQVAEQRKAATAGMN